MINGQCKINGMGCLNEKVYEIIIKTVVAAAVSVHQGDQEGKLRQNLGVVRNRHTMGHQAEAAAGPFASLSEEP